MDNSDTAWVDSAANNAIITITDDNYPPLLREIHDPPKKLYIKGDITLLTQRQIAMVGSRAPTIGGRQAAFEYAKVLTGYGLIVTSGLALGIDTAAHQGAIVNGKTIAVLGSGLNHIYPKINQKLAEQIAQSGCLVSEFAPNTPPKAYHFPQRNRIISGLAQAVFVIEATMKSGSLITARLGLEQNRDIFALPSNPLNPQSKGCHYLIKQGAILVDSPVDITDQLGIKIPAEISHKVQLPANDTKKQLVLTAIGYEVANIDEIAATTRLALADISTILVELEATGEVVRTLGGYIRRASG